MIKSFRKGNRGYFKLSEFPNSKVIVIGSGKKWNAYYSRKSISVDYCTQTLKIDKKFSLKARFFIYLINQSQLLKLNPIL